MTEDLQIGRASVEVKLQNLTWCSNRDLCEILDIVLDVLSRYLAKFAIGLLLHQSTMGYLRAERGGRKSAKIFTSPVWSHLLQRAYGLPWIRFCNLWKTGWPAWWTSSIMVKGPSTVGLMLTCKHMLADLDSANHEVRQEDSHFLKACP